MRFLTILICASLSLTAIAEDRVELFKKDLGDGRSIVAWRQTIPVSLIPEVNVSSSPLPPRVRVVPVPELWSVSFALRSAEGEEFLLYTRVVKIHQDFSYEVIDVRLESVAMLVILARETFTSFTVTLVSPGYGCAFANVHSITPWTPDPQREVQYPEDRSLLRAKIAGTLADGNLEVVVEDSRPVKERKSKEPTVLHFPLPKPGEPRRTIEPRK